MWPRLFQPNAGKLLLRINANEIARVVIFFMIYLLEHLAGIVLSDEWTFSWQNPLHRCEPAIYLLQGDKSRGYISLIAGPASVPDARRINSKGSAQLKTAAKYFCQPVKSISVRRPSL